MLPLFVTSVVTAGCANEVREIRQEMVRQQAIWQAKKPPAYEIRAYRSCFCDNDWPIPVVSVRNGVIAGSREDARSVELQTDHMSLVKDPRVEALFAEIEKILADPPDQMTVAYDPTYGFPTSISFDQREERADDEMTLTVSEFIPLSN